MAWHTAPVHAGPPPPGGHGPPADLVAAPPARFDPQPHAEQARHTLDPGARGAPTRGVWVTAPAGALQPLTSGKDDQWYHEAKALAATFPPQWRAALRLAVHVEVKFAVRMRAEQRTNETIVIDRPVCGNGPTDQGLPFTCAAMLRWFLPPGGILTVVEHDGTRRSYQGRPWG